MEPPIEPVTDEPLPSTDSRVAAVGDNLERFVATVADADGFVRGDDPDVTTLWSDYPFPLFNAISRARFAPGTVERRAREVVAAYIGRGLPFLWWATPAGHGAELGPILTGLGMVEEHVPGMYVDVVSPVDPRPPEGLVTAVVGRAELAESLDVLVEGFELPEVTRQVFAGMDALLDSDDFVQVTAWLDGEAIGCGTAWLTGDVAGLYNITTLERARGRGIGHAVTATLMNVARERGAPRVVLHASEAGLPVYRRLGFETVCDVPQFVWVPDTD